MNPVIALRLLFSVIVMIVVWFRYDWMLAIILSGITLSLEANFWTMAALAAQFAQLKRTIDNENVSPRVSHWSRNNVPRTKNPSETH